MKKFLHLIGFFLVFLIIFPRVVNVIAGLSANVSWNLIDANGDGFIDLEFSAVDLVGDPAPGIQVEVSPEDAQVSITDTPLLSGTTDSNGKVVFKSMPGGSYVWRTSGAKNGPDLIQIDPFEFETTEEDLFLEWFLFMEWMPTESSDKGRVFMESLAEFLDYDLTQNPLPVKNPEDNNFKLSRKYLKWLGDLENFADLKKGSMPVDVWSFTKKAIALPKGVLTVAARISLPDNSRAILTLSRTGRMREGQWVQFSDYTLNNHLLLLDRGYLMGWFCIFYSVFDLLILAPDMDLIFDPSADPLERWEMVLLVGADIATLASGLTNAGLYAVALMGQLKELGRVPTQQLMATSRALGYTVFVLNIVLTVLHLWITYKTWDNFVANFWTTDVLISLMSLGISVTLLALMIAKVSIVSWVPVVGWIIAGVTIIATLLYYLYDFFIGYWDKIEEYRIQLSGILTNLMDIRNVLYSIDVQDLEDSSLTHSKFASIADKFASVASGVLQDDFLWAKDYLTTLSEAENDLAEKVEPARDVLDQLIGEYLWYESSDGSKKVKGHLEGVNSTSAQYLSPGSQNHFTFNASMYHPSKNDPSIFIFDNRTVNVGFDVDGDPIPIVTYEEADYSTISTVDGKGWAWDPPAAHDNSKNILGAYDRYFAVTYTTNTSHLPPGGITGKSFYFDGNDKWYTDWPWNFDPNVYADQSSTIPDPKTGKMRSFYFYKFYFDPETTTDWAGHYNALGEWADNVKNTLDSGIVQNRLEEVSNAIDYLKWASARKRMEIRGVDTLLVIDRSGSMSGSKIDSAKAAAKQFVDLIQIGDKIGVVSYSSYVRVDYQLSDVTSPDVKSAVKSAIDQIDAGGNTAIGYGLRAAYDQLVSGTDTSRTWAIVLMSDGLHNTGEHPYDVIPDLQAQKIVVYTVGLGADADGVLLSNIASQTGGFYLFAPSLTELVGIYNDMATKITGAQTVLSTKGSIAQGESIQQAVDVDSSATQTTFTLSWQGSDLDLTLIRPDSQLIDPSVAASDPNVEHVEESTYEMYRVTSPLPGTWELVIIGTNVPAGYEDFIAKVTAITSVTISLITDRDSYTYPSPIKIVAALQHMDIGVKRANVVAEVTRPDGEEVEIVLFDDGKRSHGDTVLYDGNYTNFYIVPFGIEGSYTISVTANGTTYTGESFSRTAQKTVLVTGKLIDNTPPTTTLSASSLHYIDASGNPYVTSSTQFTLTAVDNIGAQLGVANTTYRIYNATYDTGWITSSPPISFQITNVDDGAYRINYTSTDNSGNVETTKNITVIIDNTSPTTTYSPSDGAYSEIILVTLSATDGGSGISETYYKIGKGEWTKYTVPFNLTEPGNYTIYYYSVDHLGNTEKTKFVTYEIARPFLLWHWLFVVGLGSASSFVGYLYLKARKQLKKIRQRVAQSVTCTSCKTVNSPESRFCRKCGKKIYRT